MFGQTVGGVDDAPCVVCNSVELHELLVTSCFHCYAAHKFICHNILEVVDNDDVFSCPLKYGADMFRFVGNEYVSGLPGFYEFSFFTFTRGGCPAFGLKRQGFAYCLYQAYISGE